MGTAVIGSHGVSWPAHGSTGTAQYVGSSEAGGGCSAAGRRRDHQDRFGAGDGTAAEPLHCTGAGTVDGSARCSSTWVESAVAAP
jgi:hypothetical protein